METVLEKILTECENALLQKKPIIFLETGEIDIVRRVVESDRLVVRMYRKAEAEEPMPFADCHDITLGHMRLRGEEKCWSKIINIFGYSSLEKFSNDIGSGALDYGLCKNRTIHKENNECLFPNLYIVPAPTKSEEDPKQHIVPNAYAGIHRYIDRYLEDAKKHSAISASCLLVYGERFTLPKELLPYCVVVEEPFPKTEEIVAMLDSSLEKNRLAPMLARDAWWKIARAMGGFPLMEIERLINYILSCPDINGDSSIYNVDFVRKTIATKKEQMFKKEQILELITDTSDQNAKVGGMQKFSKWLDENKDSLIDGENFKEKTGAKSLRGVLLCGVPGCGKSLAARKVQQETGLPLLRMDIGSLMGKYVGDSEGNLRKAIRQAEAMAPCILWTDELEKGFGNQGSEDSGVSKRMFGHFLTWLQECEVPVFNFATANDIAALPPEFFRSGRFDGLFALYMPTREECVDILTNQMKAHAERVSKQHTLFAFDPEAYAGDIFNGLQASGSRFCTGADIEKLVAMTLRRFFKEGKLNEPISKDSWIEYMKEILKETTVYGDGAKNIDAIACTYFRLHRDSFQPAGDACILDKGDYRVVEDPDHHGELLLEMFKAEDAKQSKAQKRVNRMDKYDQDLFHVVIERLKVLAPLMETAARHKVTGIR